MSICSRRDRAHGLPCYCLCRLPRSILSRSDVIWTARCFCSSWAEAYIEAGRSVAGRTVDRCRDWRARTCDVWAAQRCLSPPCRAGTDRAVTAYGRVAAAPLLLQLLLALPPFGWHQQHAASDTTTSTDDARQYSHQRCRDTDFIFCCRRRRSESVRSTRSSPLALPGVCFLRHVTDVRIDRRGLSKQFVNTARPAAYAPPPPPPPTRHTTSRQDVYISFSNFLPVLVSYLPDRRSPSEVRLDCRCCRSCRRRREAEFL